MSYEIAITDNNGRHAYIPRDNYTSNVGPMFYACIPAGNGGRYDVHGRQTEYTTGIPGLSGLPTERVAELLGQGIAAMVERADEMQALNPPNGYGNYDAALEWLCGLKDACEQNPGHTFWANW